VTITPLVLLYLRGEIGGWVRQASARQLGEAVLLLALVAIVTIAVFTQTRFPLLFLPLLPMMVAVFRLGLSIGVQKGPPIGVQKGPPSSSSVTGMTGAPFALVAA
jgi:integral membrane sensor domain MASE1